MVKPTFVRTGRPVSKSEVNSVEKLLGVSLPQQYVDFLVENNGGSPRPSCFKVDGHDEEIFELHYFFHCHSIDRKLDLASLNEYTSTSFPDGWVQIATTTTGDHILIDCDAGGRVYFCDYVGRENAKISEIASGFDVFLNGFFEWASE